MIAKKEKTTAVLIKEADEIFSDYIRLRDARPYTGLVSCLICGASMHWKMSQAMHYVRREEMPTRYDAINVNAGCENCNCFDQDHKDSYTRAMADVYGVVVTGNLIIKARALAKFTRSDLQFMIEEYKEKVQQLKKQKHL